MRSMSSSTRLSTISASIATSARCGGRSRVTKCDDLMSMGTGGVYMGARPCWWAYGHVAGGKWGDWSERQMATGSQIAVVRSNRPSLTYLPRTSPPRRLNDQRWLAPVATHRPPSRTGLHLAAAYPVHPTVVYWAAAPPAPPPAPPPPPPSLGGSGPAAFMRSTKMKPPIMSPYFCRNVFSGSGSLTLPPSSTSGGAARPGLPLALRIPKCYL